MLKCREVSEQMSDYIDGETTLARRAGLAFHLLMCGHCRRFFRQLRLVSESVKEQPESDMRLDEEAARGIAEWTRHEALREHDGARESHDIPDDNTDNKRD